MYGMDTLEANATQACALLKTMSNEWRLLILCHLSERELSVRQIEGATGLNQSALSQHLAVLRRQNIVKTRRQAQSVFYSIDSPAAMALMDTLHDIFCNDDPDDVRGKDR